MRCRVKSSFPDVVLQVSWKGKMDYESGAIDDLMNRVAARGLVDLDRRPQLGYLISFRLGSGENNALTGIDLYTVPKGMTLEARRCQHCWQ